MTLASLLSCVTLDPKAFRLMPLLVVVEEVVEEVEEGVVEVVGAAVVEVERTETTLTCFATAALR